MSLLRVGVLRGGPSSEYDVSLKTGAAMLRALDESRYQGVDIFIDREGVWHVYGEPTTPKILQHRVDVVLNALRGIYGEDGKVAKVLSQFGVPYSGSHAGPSAVAQNKILAKQTFRAHGIRTPLFNRIDHEREGEGVYLSTFATLSPPYMIKPVYGGSSRGVRLAHHKDEFVSHLGTLRAHAPLFVESYIPGREASIGVIEHFRGEDLYTLPPVEIIPPAGHHFFDEDIQYGEDARKICPGNFSKEEKSLLQDIARKVHRALGLRHYSRTDCIVARNGIYVLEVNTLPSLTETSLFPKALHAVGSSLPEFLDHIITLVRTK